MSHRFGGIRIDGTHLILDIACGAGLIIGTALFLYGWFRKHEVSYELQLSKVYLLHLH